MVNVLMEDFFPMEVPPGNHSTMDNWRKMAQLWCADGVVNPDLSFMPTERHPLSVYGWDWANSAASVAPGGCWVNGFYGQADAAKRLVVGAPPDWGLVVARYDNVQQNISIVYRGGAGPPDVVRDPVGWWEIPLAQMNTDGSITDLRRYVPLADLTPGIPEIPAWVPRGQFPPGAWGWGYGPATQLDVQGPTTVDLMVLYPGTQPAFFVPGRSYRFAALAAPSLPFSQPDFALRFVIRDDRGHVFDEWLVRMNQTAQASALNGNPYSALATIGDAHANLVGILQIVVQGAGIVRFEVGSLVMSCEDAGA